MIFLDDWLKPKGYVHFTTKFNIKNPKTQKYLHGYISRAQNIFQHGFYPLIYKAIWARKYKKTGDLFNNKKLRSHFIMGEQGEKKSFAKPRHIFYATHIDAYIYSYYTNKVLSPLYEDALSKINGLSDCITGYRKILIDKNSKNGKNKNNIYFAKDVFDYIKQQKNCVVLCFDISSFFDSLNHKYLKQQWCKLLEVPSLPPDHYNIYKSLTSFKYVHLRDVMNEYGFRNHFQLKKRKVLSFNASHEDFQEKIRKKFLVYPHKFKDKNNKNIGIPQGTPISAFLSNLYLLEFDKLLYLQTQNINGLYRRYPDDIIVVCRKDYVEEVKSFVLTLIDNECLLTINKEKVDENYFEEGDNSINCSNPLKYLGFEFDGVNIRIKQASLAKYYRGLKHCVKSQARKAYHSIRQKKLKGFKSNYGSLFKNRIYKRYSHLGGKTRERNFYTYAKDAFTITGDVAIQKQLRGAWSILNSYIEKNEIKYKLKR